MTEAFLCQQYSLVSLFFFSLNSNELFCASFLYFSLNFSFSQSVSLFLPLYRHLSHSLTTLFLPLSLPLSTSLISFLFSIVSPIVRGSLYKKVKKSFLWFCNCIVFYWCPRYTKKFCSAIRDGEHGFLSHTHFYRGKIDRFCIKWC